VKETLAAAVNGRRWARLAADLEAAAIHPEPESHLCELEVA